MFNIKKRKERKERENLINAISKELDTNNQYYLFAQPARSSTYEEKADLMRVRVNCFNNVAPLTAKEMNIKEGGYVTAKFKDIDVLVPLHWAKYIVDANSNIMGLEQIKETILEHIINNN